MTQLRYLLEDIKHNKFNFVWNIIQMFAVGMILVVLLNSYWQYKDEKTKLEHMTWEGEIHMFADDTPYARMDALLNEKAMEKKLQKLYQVTQTKLKEIDGGKDSFVVNTSCHFSFPSEEKKMYQRVITDKEAVEDESLPLAMVSENFFSVCQIAYDGDLSALAKSSDDEAIPVFLGNDYHELYQVGDVFKDYIEKEYCVVGFLKQGEYFIEPGAGREPRCLDSYIVRISRTDAKDVVSIMNYFSSTYFPEKYKTVMEEVAAYAHKQGTLELQVNSFSYQMNMITKDLIDEMVLFGSVAVIFLIFCVISMTGNILNFLSDFRRELAIHCMCGASRRSMVIRVLLQIWGMYLVSAVIVCGVKGFRPETGVSLLVLAVYVFVLSYVPVVLLRRRTIREMLQITYS